MKLILSIFSVLMMTVATQTSVAQVAYYNSDEIVKVMPEYMEVKDSLQNLSETSGAESEKLENSRERLERERISEGDDMDEAEYNKRAKAIEAEVAEQKKAESGVISQTEQNLMAPLYAKVKAAADKVAKENDFKKTYDTAQESKPPKDGWANITVGILKELGISK